MKFKSLFLFCVAIVFCSFGDNDKKIINKKITKNKLTSCETIQQLTEDINDSCLVKSFAIKITHAGALKEFYCKNNNINDDAREYINQLVVGDKLYLDIKESSCHLTSKPTYKIVIE